MGVVITNSNNSKQEYLHNEAVSKRSPQECSSTIIESQVRVRTRVYVPNQNRNTYNIPEFLRGHVWSALDYIIVHFTAIADMS
jgi:hypothetical protein